jgi:hypothetical protein
MDPISKKEELHTLVDAWTPEAPSALVSMMHKILCSALKGKKCFV